MLLTISSGRLASWTKTETDSNLQDHATKTIVCRPRHVSRYGSSYLYLATSEIWCRFGGRGIL